MVTASLKGSKSFAKFLEKIASTYNSPLGFPKLTKFSEKYNGRYLGELKIIMQHIYAVNNGSNSRIFSLDVSDLEQILDKSNYKQL